MLDRHLQTPWKPAAVQESLACLTRIEKVSFLWNSTLVQIHESPEPHWMQPGIISICWAHQSCACLNKRDLNERKKQQRFFTPSLEIHLSSIKCSRCCCVVSVSWWFVCSWSLHSLQVQVHQKRTKDQVQGRSEAGDQTQTSLLSGEDDIVSEVFHFYLFLSFHDWP